MTRYKMDELDRDAMEGKTRNHLDVAETAYFKRQIEYVKTKTYDKKYRNLHAMMLIPVNTSVASGTKYIVWYSYSKAGLAKIISDYANDFSRVDVYAEENEVKVHHIGIAYGYNIPELRRAAVAGDALDTKRAMVARRAIDEKIDQIAWFGDREYKLQGFFNYPGISEYVVPQGADGSTKWASKTPDEINADLVGICNMISVPTNGREMPDTILLPRKLYNHLKTTRMGGASDTTIYKFFMDNNKSDDDMTPNVMLMPLDELNNYPSKTVNRFYAYRRDMDSLTLEIPQMFEMTEPEKKGLSWEIPCYAETGGIIVYYPASIAFGEGI